MEDSVPQGMACMKTLSNASMKRSLLQHHFQANHPEKKDRDSIYFKRNNELGNLNALLTGFHSLL